jgi:hypothetical protein
MAYEEKENEKSVWNIDDEILKIIKDLKSIFIIHMKDFRLEDAYWKLDALCMECDARLNNKEREEIENALKILEGNRQTYSKNGKGQAGEFYVNLRNLYKKINRMMVEHGVWFRAFEDDEDET